MKSKSLAFVFVFVFVVLALVACRPAVAELELDPALNAEDPSALRGDAWDRDAAARIDRSRGTKLRALLMNPSADREVIETLRTTKAGKRSDEVRSGRVPSWAGETLLIRRARAAYDAAAEAMQSEDAKARAWGLDILEFVEGRKRGGSSSHGPGPSYEGKERDAALTAAAHLLTSDPSSELRAQAVSMMSTVLPDHDEPSPEALAAALAREKEEDHRVWLLWLIAKRRTPPQLLLDSATQGFRDPTSIAVAIHDLFVEANRELLEAAFAKGNAAFRAGIGETFYRHQSSMPWARALILKGLADSNSAVRVRFAKGTLVLRPFDEEVRARLEALAEGAYTARWALAINDEREPESPPDDESEYNPIPEAGAR